MFWNLFHILGTTKLSSLFSVSPTFAIGLTVAVAFILLASNFVIIYAQVLPQQQVQSDGGGLTATLNGSSFTSGDTITVSGRVGERDPNSNVLIRVIDPQSNEVESGVVDVTADNTFTYSFVAGKQEEFDPNEPMVISGNYRVVVNYITPVFDNEAVELTFAYNTFPQTPQEGAITASPSPPNGRGPITTSSAAAATTFQSVNDSFRVEVPQGWTVHDFNNTGSMLLEESREGYGILAQLCPEEELPQQRAAASSISSRGNTSSTGSYSNTTNNSCQGAQQVVHVIRYPDLDTRISTASNATSTNSSTMTIEDVLSYSLQKLQEVGYNSLQIVNSTDMTVNITNPQTNQTIATLPAKFAEMTYTISSAPDEIKRGYFILTATAATPPNEGIVKGYSVFHEGNGNTSTAARLEITTTSASSGLSPVPLLLPAAVQIFDSFELIAVPKVTGISPAQGGATAGQTQGGATAGSGDLNCEDIAERNFPIDPNNDPNGFDGDNDGVGCETGAFGEVIEPETGGGGNVGGDDDNTAGGDNSCHPSYPDTCIPPPPPNLNCDDIGDTNFEVVGSDPHGFDGDDDGVGCESGVGGGVPDDDGGDDEGGDDDGGDDEGGDDEGGDFDDCIVVGEPSGDDCDFTPDDDGGGDEGGGDDGGGDEGGGDDGGGDEGGGDDGGGDEGGGDDGGGDEGGGDDGGGDIDG